jgi:hypothetical protein
MNDTTTILMRLMEENWLHARQSEEKRATLAIAILVITSTSQITLVFTGFSIRVLPLTLFLSLLGIYALVFCLKLYERQIFHTSRARKLRARLNDLYPEAEAEQLLKAAEAEHSARHPFAHVRLHHIWLCLHALIVVIGLVETVLCFISIQ